MKKKKKKDIIAHRNFEKLHRFDFSKLTLFSSKVIHGWFILLLIFLSLLFCGKSPQKIITLPEISPDGGGALSSKQEKISPSIGMITEIEEVGGVQKYIYIK
ncbi:MAG: hypothetical protein SVR08_15410, partial [Spirochaetota bacterium]|nr:hypothetical protein [Spirochaetota bacterium]